jgi:hypothetical protein
MATSGPVSARVRFTATRVIYSYLHSYLLLPLLFPKPSKYRRLVLRSSAAGRTQPINPAASANSYADPTVASRPLVILQGDPYQVRRRLAVHAGAVTKASTERCGKPNRDPLRSHVRHRTTSVRHPPRLPRGPSHHVSPAAGQTPAQPLELIYARCVSLVREIRLRTLTVITARFL